MLIKTHILAALFLALIFLPKENYFVFLGIALVASVIPDIDSRFSKIGKKKSFRILQFFIKHRGIVHSLFFLSVIEILLWKFFPVAILPFALGFGSHLLLDGFTKQGIRLFYPINLKVHGFVKVGGRMETVVFVFLLIGSLFLAFWKIFFI